MSALSEIKARLEKEPDNLNMLNLEGIKIGTITEDIKQYLERFKKVKVLILRQCELTSLDNLPPWKLAAIDLSENK
jgi:ribosomal protein L30/L7E